MIRTKISTTVSKSILLAVLLSLVTVGCQREQDLLFEPGNKRALDLLENLENTLIANPNGWEMLYTIDNDDIKAQFTLQLQFDKNKQVKMWADFLDEPVTSSYALNLYDGPTISFDTPGAITELADPANTAYPGDKKGKGYYGEIDFTIMSVSKESIVLRGLKYGRDFVLKPLTKPADLTNNGFADMMRTAVARLTVFGDYRTLERNGIVLNDVTFIIPELGRFISSTAEMPEFTMVVEAAAEGEVDAEYQLIPTDAGFAVVPAIEIDGKQYSELIFDGDNMRLTIKGNDDVYINLKHANLTDKLLNGVFVDGFYMAGMSPALMAVAGPDKLGEIFPGFVTVQLYNMSGLKSLAFLHKKNGENNWQEIVLDGISVIDPDQQIYSLDFAGAVAGDELLNALNSDGVNAAKYICFFFTSLGEQPVIIEEVVEDKRIRITSSYSLGEPGNVWIEFEAFGS
ncbi:MAG: DUF4302 domain-containing protein [Porphyromonas sp.]|nr:DUF4302 domain-containing protein [Porphyromonas sp.]